MIVRERRDLNGNREVVIDADLVDWRTCRNQRQRKPRWFEPRAFSVRRTCGALVLVTTEPLTCPLCHARVP